MLYPDRPYRYEVDLDCCTTSAQVLDRVCQIAGKTWADDATLAGLVRALNDVLQPQATLCSLGTDHHLNQAGIDRQVTAATERLLDEEASR